MKQVYFLTLIGILFNFNLLISQATYQAITSGNWNDPLIWNNVGVADSDGDGFPDANDAVTILSNAGGATNVSVNIVGAQCATLHIGDALAANNEHATLDVNAGFDLTVSGATTLGGHNRRGIFQLIVNGTFNGSTLDLATTTANNRDNRLIVNGGGEAIFTGDVIANHTANTNRNYYDLNGTGILRVGGNFTGNVNALVNPNAASTVEYTGAAQNINFDDFGNLILSGSGIKDITSTSGNVDVNGNLTINGTASFDFRAGNTLTLDKNFDVNTTTATPLITNGETVILASNSTKNITNDGGNTLTFQDLTLFGGNGNDAHFLTGLVTIAGDYLSNTTGRNSDLEINGADVTIVGSCTISAPTGGNGVNELIVTSGSLTAGSIDLTNSGDDARDARILISGGTTDLSGSINMPASIIRNFLIFSGTGDLNIEGNITGGTVNSSGTGTVTFDGVGAHTIGGVHTLGGGSGYDFPNVTFDGSGLATLATDVIVNENVSFITNGALDVTATPFNINVGGNWSNTSLAADPFVEQTGTVTFDGQKGQVISSSETFNNVEIDLNNTAVSSTGALVTIASLTLNPNVNSGPLSYSQTSGSTVVTGTTLVTGDNSGTNDNGIYGNGGSITLTGVTLNQGTSNNRDAVLTIQNGNVDVNGDIIMNGAAVRSYVEYTGNGVLNCSGDIFGGDMIVTGGTGELRMDGAAAQTLGGIGTATAGGTDYDIVDLYIENTSATSLGTNVTTQNFEILASGTFDVTATNHQLSVSENFTINAAHTLGAGGDPFNEREGRVILNGSTATAQEITNGLGTQQTFYSLEIDNASGLKPALNSNEDLLLSEFDIANGELDMKGNNIVLTGVNDLVSSLANGSIITSIAGTTFTHSDPMRNIGAPAGDNSHNLIFGNSSGAHGAAAVSFILGNSTNNINFSAINVGRVNFNGGQFFGTVTVIYDYDDTGNGSTSYGGNIFEEDVYFETLVGSNRLRSALNSPDVYKKKLDILHNGFSNFIISRGSDNNQYLGDVTLESGAPGGLYVGRTNGNNGTSSSLFDGINVKLALNQGGILHIGDADANDVQTTTFNDCVIDIEMATTATGRIQIGEEKTECDVIFSGTTRLENSAGDCEGSATLELSHITQTGTGNHTLFVGDNATVDRQSDLELGRNSSNAILFPNTWLGNFSLETSRFVTFYGNVFNGATNSLLMTGENGHSDNNGGNSSAAGTATTFICNNTNSRRFRIGSNATAGPNNWDGNVVFIETNGSLEPARTQNSTFAGNISTVGSTGQVYFGVGGGTVVIDGTGAQQWLGDATTDALVDDIDMVNTGSGITLGDKVIVVNQLSLQDGVITTAVGAELELQATASLEVGFTGSDASHVDGPLRKIGNTNFQFPVGEGGFHSPVLLANMDGGATGVFTVEYFDASHPDKTVLAPLHHISNIEYWDISPTLHTRADVTLNWHDDPRSGVTDCAFLTMAHYNGADWEDYGKDACALGGSISKLAVTGFSPFTLASDDLTWGGQNPLPIELISFDAEINVDQVDLSWETASEINNDFFVVEKSIDGDSWSQVLKKDGAGNSTQHITYFDLDLNPSEGTSYYRLKQVDFNGEFSYSNVVPVKYEKHYNGAVSVFPNPTITGNVNVKLDGFKDSEVVVAVRDIQGKEYYSKVQLIETSGQIVALDLENKLSAGVYLITVSSTNELFSQKLIIR